MPEPTEILDMSIKRAQEHIEDPFVQNEEIQQRIEYVCRCKGNRAGARVLLAGLTAKIDDPTLDIRKPYTAIEEDGTYSGRGYDEAYVTPLINFHDLPCNATTAFLTPALRNRNETLTPETQIEGRPRALYDNLLQILTDVQENRVRANDALNETLRCLLMVKRQRETELRQVLQSLASHEESLPLSSEGVVKLIQQHLDCPHSSRLPVLIVAAAYQAAESQLGERVLPLASHTAADSQTGKLGDLEMTLKDDEDIITTYEMKTRRVSENDIEQALQKLRETNTRVDNYLFITTEPIDAGVQEYAYSLYDELGIEFAILDCIGFLRHFLHLFHRLRIDFLNKYQQLLIEEPDSAVRHELKKAFLTLREAAETGHS